MVLGEIPYRIYNHTSSNRILIMPVNKVKNMYIHEILEKAGNAPTRKEKIEVLHRYNTRALRDVLKGAFDDSVTFNLPSGDPPYRPGSEVHPATTLRKQCKKFPHFVASPTRPKATPKIEQIFVKMLESLHPGEAELVLWMKSKKTWGRYKGVTKKLVMDAFPGLISQ